MSKLTSRQDEMEDFWLFKEDLEFDDQQTGTQDPLMAKYFEVAQDPQPNHPSTTNIQHSRSQSQSSAGCSSTGGLGSCGALDSEMGDLCIEDMSMPDVNNVRVELKRTKSTGSTAIPIPFKLYSEEQQPPEQQDEDPLLMKMFAKYKLKDQNITSMPKEQWRRAKELLFAIKDLEESILRPLSIVLNADERKEMMKTRWQELERLESLLDQAGNLLSDYFA